MTSIGFADESGTDASCPCYTIGVLIVPALHLRDFEQTLARLRERHVIQHELKWNRIGTSHNAINFTLDALSTIVCSQTATFDAMVVRKSTFRNWRGGFRQKETAFYQTYTLLLHHIVGRTRQPAVIYIDDRPDAYAKQGEVVATVCNRMLGRLARAGRVENVLKSDSRTLLGIQIADLLAGAINSSHWLWINRRAPVNHGKRLAMSRMAGVVGWDALWYDTRPHRKFNIWHFPEDYRAIPATRVPVPQRRVAYVSASDIRVQRERS